jgi:hypothetical protein
VDRVTDRRQVAEVDVAAVVAEVLAEHAPGTSVAGPESGGVQVIRVSLDVATFRELLTALAATLGEGSHLRLAVVGGLLYLDVTGSHARAEDAGPIGDLVRALGGHIVPEPLAAEGFSVQLPTGLSEWD